MKFQFSPFHMERKFQDCILAVRECGAMSLWIPHEYAASFPPYAGERNIAVRQVGLDMHGVKFLCAVMRRA